MSRWEDEGIVYKRIRNWTSDSDHDEFIRVVSNFGTMIVRLNYDNGTIDFYKVNNADGNYREVGYFPIEEMEEIVGHMKNTMKRWRKQFEESTK